MARPISCKMGFNPSPFSGAGNDRKKGLEVKVVKAEKAAIISDCEERMTIFIFDSMLLKKAKDRLYKHKIVMSRSIDPS